jgi:hypothetical protein
VVRAFEVHVIDHWGVEGWSLGGHSVWLLTGLSAILSNLVSNVPGGQQRLQDLHE